MSKIFKFKNIQSDYTNIISSYITKGYEILFDDTSRGCKICTQLVNDIEMPNKKLFIICEDSRFDMWYDCVTIEGRIMNRDQRFRNDTDEIIFRYTYYNITSRYDGKTNVYTDDKEFALDCIKKHRKRNNARCINNHIELKPTSKIMNHVRTHKNFKSATKKGTRIYKKHGRYYIEFNNHSYYLEPKSA